MNTENKPDYLITLPRRGLKVIAPEHTARVMALARQHKKEGTRYTDEERAALWPDTEKARLYIMKRCGILAKRYPKPEDGRKFMPEVDYSRRDELLQVAGELTADVVSAWNSINPQKDIAVLLFGSVAKCLVKNGDHPDPSNIDLAVIGDISAEEREKLLDEIRPRRHRIQNWILERVPFLNTDERNPGNVGFMVQNVNKLRKDQMEPARNYIASSAIPLYDPAGIWTGLEREALLLTVEKMQKQKNHKPAKPLTVFSR